MADFRRWILAFAALVLVLGSVVPASAQTNQVSCSVNAAVTPTLRAEGLTELVGDILLVCQGVPGSAPAAPGVPMAQADISVSFPATLSTSMVGAGLDAVLVVDDPTPANQHVCPTPTNAAGCLDFGDGGMGFNLTETPTKYNVFQGILGGPAGPLHSITFLGVPIDPPGTAVTLTYRITNIRIQSPSVPGAVSAGTGGIVPVLAFVSTSSSTSISIGQNTQQVVGYVYPGLTFSASGTNPSFLQCLDYSDQNVGTITFAEGFPNSFKQKYPSLCGPTTLNGESLVDCQTQPGVVYTSESGLNIPVPGGITGIPSSATQLEAVISNIPSGVIVCVDTSNTDAQGISATIISPTGLTTGGCGDGQTEVLDTTKASTCTSETATTPGTCGSVTVVWGITQSNLAAFPASLSFNVYTTFTGTPANPGGSPTPNVIAYAQGGFNPQVSGWANGGPVPEFVTGLYPAPPSLGIPLFQVNLCQTILLFPYVTDYVGFDTGIAISNTSYDTGSLPTGLGAANQAGTCTVTFYGDAGIATNFGTMGAYTSAAAIAPGSTWAFGLSPIDTTWGTAAFTGTTGYAIAVCNFQYAHGYTFVSDYGLRNFAAAYLALVIPDAPRSPNPFFCASVPGYYCGGQAGEQLVH
jgi:hypothetical protein